MKEQENQPGLPSLPASLRPEDRLVLEMLVVDEDDVEAQSMLSQYEVETPEGVSPLSTCQQWLRSLKNTERHHCQNILDLHSQGKSIGGMQALATSIREEAK